MKKVVSFSGGRTSAYLCKVMIEKFGRDNVDFIYMDTGAEHPKTYEFIKNVDHEFGLDLVCLRGNFDSPLGVGATFEVVDVESIGCDLLPFASYANKYGTPTVTGASCTSRMKEETHDRYCNVVYPDKPNLVKYNKKKGKHVFSQFKKQYETWIGIRADEPELCANFLSLIDNANDRKDLVKKPPKEIMYRSKQSLISVIDAYKDLTRAEIAQTIRGMRSMDTGSCSESCEVFSGAL